MVSAKVVVLFLAAYSLLTNRPVMEEWYLFAIVLSLGQRYGV